MGRWRASGSSSCRTSRSKHDPPVPPRFRPGLVIEQVKAPPAARDTWLPMLVEQINRAVRQASESGPPFPTLTAADISDFAEATDDQVAGLLKQGSGITLTYNDAAGELTISASTPPAPAWTLIGTQNTTSGSSVTFSSIPATYEDLLLVFNGVNDTGGALLQLELSPNGSTWAGPVALGAVGGATYGSLGIPGYRKGAGQVIGAGTVAASDNTLADATIFALHGWRISAGIQAARVSLASGSFSAGSISLFGK